jgi:hypothetical protein
MSDVMMGQDTASTTTSSKQTNPAMVYTPSNVFQDETQQGEVMNYLVSEILDVRDGNERKDLETRWQKWRRQRRARPERETRNSPWKNAANITPPLTAQKVNTIFAKEVAAFASKKPPVTVEVSDVRYTEHAEALERFFKRMVESESALDMAKNLQTIFYEQISMGTEIVKVPFLVEKWAFKRKNALSGAVEQVTYTRRQSPVVQPVRLEDFFTRPYWKDLQRAPWIAIRYRYYRHELEQQVAMGAFDQDAVNMVVSAPLQAYDDGLVAAQAQRGVSADSLGKTEANQEFEVYECYLFWDVDGDGISEDVKLWVHPETGALLRSEFNPLSMRDIVPVIYLHDPDILYGIGVCELTESLQDEVTTLHNMRIDGTTLAMQKVWAARRGLGLKDEEISPLTVIEMDDPHQDLNVIAFPDVAPSCLSGEMVAKDYADKVTGANDYMAGFNDQTVGTAATVGGTMFLAQQANSILNSILQNAEMAISNIYQIALFQCMANKDLLDLSFLSQEDQVLLQQIFAMNVEQIPTQFQFKVEATDITKTEESKKQAYLAMTQTYSMYAEKGFQLLQVMQQVGALQNPQLMADFAQSVFVGSTEFMKNMLEFFDVGDPEEYLPFVDDMKLQLQMMDRQKAAQVAVMKQQFLAQTNNNNAAAPQTTAASLGVGTNGPAVGGINGQGEVGIGAGPMPQGSPQVPGAPGIGPGNPILGQQ